MTPDAAPSRLHRLWSGTWRLFLAIITGLFAFVGTYGSILELAPPRDLDVVSLGVRMLIDVCLGVVAIALYPFRHRAPLLIAIVIVAATVVSAAATGAAMLVTVSVSTRRRAREIVPVALIMLVAGVIAEHTLPQQDPLPLWVVVLLFALSTGVLVVTGLYIGGRRQLHQSLRDQVESERRERAAHVEQARASERTRIAREMHDTLAHRLSLVSLHAGALEFRSDLSREQIARAAATVRENAQLAGEELRAVLGVLRGPSGTAAEHDILVQPSLRNLDDLMVASARAGSPVALTVDSRVAPMWESLTEALSRTLFRVIQEAVTNARKHAPGAPVRIHVSGEPEVTLSLTISNEMGRASARGETEPAGRAAEGLGLVGLAERVRLTGGELDVSRSGENDDFVLTVWFPWTA